MISVFKKQAGATSSGFNALGRPLKFRNAAEAGCSIVRLMPEDGLVFYLPLDKGASTAVTGQGLSKSGTVTYETVDGIPCAYFYNGVIWSNDLNGLPSGSSPRTISAWVRPAADTDFDGYAFGYGNRAANRYYGIDIDANSGQTLYIACSGNSAPGNRPVYNANAWHHIVGAYDGSLLRFYVNGNMTANEAFPTAKLETSLTQIDIGGVSNNNGLYIKGHVAGCRIYNRALTDEEVKMLSKEFKI